MKEFEEVLAMQKKANMEVLKKIVGSGNSNSGNGRRRKEEEKKKKKDENGRAIRVMDHSIFHQQRAQ